ncbi:MAG: 4Fe-4S cluster-binding domain-containing protein [Lachnospiraceae bacterium]
MVKALCLHIAHDCNLACQYCFAEEGEYHGRRALMSFEVGKKALDFLIANSGSRRNLEVDFFGGEPLMNWQVVKDLVRLRTGTGENSQQEFPFYPDDERCAPQR